MCVLRERESVYAKRERVCAKSVEVYGERESPKSVEVCAEREREREREVYSERFISKYNYKLGFQKISISFFHH